MEVSANWVGGGWKSPQLPELRARRPRGPEGGSRAAPGQTRSPGVGPPAIPDDRLVLGEGAELSLREGALAEMGRRTYRNGLGPGRVKRKKLFSSQALGRGGGSTSSQATATFPDLLPALPPPVPTGHPARESMTQPETSPPGGWSPASLGVLYRWLGSGGSVGLPWRSASVPPPQAPPKNSALILHN